MAQKKKKSTVRERHNGFIVNVLTLIVLILIVFEGKSLISLFSHVDMKARIREQEQEVFASANLDTPKSETEAAADVEKSTEASADSSDSSDSDKSSSESEASNAKATSTEDSARTAGIPDGCEDYLSSIVPAQHSPVPDGYFSDAVFIGDSRMEGFHHFSGISGSNFVTAVGMQLQNFHTEAQIATAKGNVTVLQALKDMNFSKIYMMIGTNELGAYDMNTVREEYAKALSDIKTLSSSKNPTVYVFSVIYVEEALTEADYVNNANVDKVNSEILRMCKENGYHYINLNEIFSDGNHALLPGVSEDGVHLDTEHCQQWLEYTRYHYLPSV